MILYEVMQMKPNQPKSAGSVNISKTKMLIFKIIFCLIAAVIISLVIFYFIDIQDKEASYFTKHFAISIILLMCAIVAFILPYVSSKSYRGDKKGDKMMIVISFLLFAFAIFQMILSYL